MYKLLKLAFISLLMLCFSACREEDPIMPPEQQTAEKTIFVFMPYSNNLYSFLLGNIEDMKKAIVRNKGLGNTRLLLFVAKDKQHSALIDIRYKKGVCTQDTLLAYLSYDERQSGTAEQDEGVCAGAPLRHDSGQPRHGMDTKLYSVQPEEVALLRRTI